MEATVEHEMTSPSIIDKSTQKTAGTTKRKRSSESPGSPPLSSLQETPKKAFKHQEWFEECVSLCRSLERHDYRWDEVFLDAHSEGPRSLEDFREECLATQKWFISSLEQLDRQVAMASNCIAAMRRG